MKSPNTPLSPRDPNGQPLFLCRLAIENNASKAIDQLSGICAGMLADGTVNDAEARFFQEWLVRYAIHEPVWPLTAILERVSAIFADGRLSEDERQELADIMGQLCGASKEANPTVDYATTLPVDRLAAPLSSSDLQSKIVRITGRFAFGTRQRVIDAFLAHGAEASDTPPTRTTDLLVIGHFASRDWIHTNYGRKIERAVELRSSGAPITILSEKDVSHLLQ